VILVSQYKVSVIFPIYNGEKYISNLINSMKKQTINFENLEIIFIDNKSTDNSLNLLKSLDNKYSNVKLVVLDKHYPTPGKSRNMGIITSTADYIMMCDEDDLFTEDYVERMFNAISSNKLDLVSSRYTVVTDKKSLNNSFLDNENSDILINSIREYPEIIQTLANLTVWNKIYNKKFIIDNDIKFIEDHWNEDYLFSLECYIKAQGIMLFTHYSGYLYKIHPNSQTQKNISKEELDDDLFDTLSQTKEFLLKNNFEVYPYISELLVTYIKFFLRSNYNKNDFNYIYNKFKPWLKGYSIKTRLINLSLLFNIIINITIKIFSINKIFVSIASKLYKMIT